MPRTAKLLLGGGGENVGVDCGKLYISDPQICVMFTEVTLRNWVHDQVQALLARCLVDIYSGLSYQAKAPRIHVSFGILPKMKTVNNVMFHVAEPLNGSL